MLNIRRRLVRLVRPRQQMVYAAFMVSGLLLELVLLAIFLARFHLLVEALESERLLNPVGAGVLYKAISDARYILLGASSLLVAIAAYAGVSLSSRVYGPVVAFHRHIQKLKNGDYASRVHLRGGDDLHDLRDALNELADALEHKT